MIQERFAKKTKISEKIFNAALRRRDSFNGAPRIIETKKNGFGGPAIIVSIIIDVPQKRDRENRLAETEEIQRYPRE
ncbi:MAG TPA: hypothetical protein DEB39_16230 [Planctomycetaceae bacterium]|nr:hypothetical protein [Planctomycetaceae bacterium]